MRPCLPLLMRARDKIADPAKWGKGGRCDGRGMDTFCAAEAIEEAYAPGWLLHRSEAFRKLHQAAGLPQSSGSLVDWNDAPERTHAEVLAAFDKAIEASS